PGVASPTTHQPPRVSAECVGAMAARRLLSQREGEGSVETERRVLSLVRQSRGVEHEAEVALLYRALHATLRRYAVRLVDRDDADDVVQDAMLKYLAQRERQGKALAPDAARLRLLSMVKDAARDRLRRGRRESRLMQLITGPSAAVRRWMSARRPA